MKKKVVIILLLKLVIIVSFSCELKHKNSPNESKKLFLFRSQRRTMPNMKMMSKDEDIILFEDFESENDSWNVYNGEISYVNFDNNKAVSIDCDENETFYLYKEIYNYNPVENDINFSLTNHCDLFAYNDFTFNYYFLIENQDSFVENVEYRTIKHNYIGGSISNDSSVINFTLPKGSKRIFWALEINPKNNKKIIIDDIGLSFNKYIRANDKKIFKSNNLLQLKSVSFSNYYFDDYADFTEYKHHDYNDWSNVKSLGFNTVRFAINANWWYLDQSPNKEKFWDWLDNNIDDAEDNGIYVILDMHIPVGDNYLDQSGDPQSRETVFNTPEYKEAFFKLTEKLAIRYKEREIIAAYQIFNEPVTAYGKEQWIGDGKEVKGMAQELVDLIRNHNENHMIMVDLVCGEYCKYNLGPDERFFEVDDPMKNVIYNFNYYNPVDFTHQGATWTEVPMPLDVKYPDDSNIYPITKPIFIDFTPLKEEEKSDYFGGANIENAENWKEFSSVFNYKKIFTSSNYFVSFELKAQDFIGEVYVDNIKIEKLGSDGQVEKVFTDTIDKTSKLDWWNYTLNENSKSDVFIYGEHGMEEEPEDKLSLGIKTISAINGSWGRSKYFIGNENIKYKISGYMKGDIQAGEAGLVLTYYNFFDYMKGDKEYLRHLIDPFIKWKESISSPVSIAEFGLMKECFDYITGTDEERGGSQYMIDFLSILKETEIPCFNFWSYHSDTMGIYIHEDGNYYQPVAESKQLDKLVHILQNKL